jgi:hypothetical protein
MLVMVLVVACNAKKQQKITWRIGTSCVYENHGDCRVLMELCSLTLLGICRSSGPPPLAEVK